MGFLSFFKKKETDKLDGFSKEFEPNLVGLLKNDHAALLTHFKTIHASAKAKNLEVFKEELKKFNQVLKSHLVVENIKFYSYLEELYMDDMDMRKNIHSHRVEMESIAASINRFINKNIHAPELSDAGWSLVNTELPLLYGVLIKRIDVEEHELYNLYKKSL